ncbi:MAG TPA: pilus assembly protein TadG-related protein [Terriglobales bacterium]|nr:pilus assembly protein TadG-related protein [Terriglobales bacterium]
MANCYFPRLRMLRGDDEGQALVLTALGVMMLLMMAAIGLDVGYLHYEKQQMQKAADAAAIAAATTLAYSGDYTDAALHDSAANGFINGTNNVTVTVNNPPRTPTDPFYLNSSYVEVIVTKLQPTFFMKVDNTGLVNVRSRSVANVNGNASGCVYALAPTGSGTLLVDGNVSLSSTCGIYVESNDSFALIKNGNSGTIAVSGPPNIGIGIVGDSPGFKGAPITPPPVVGIPHFNDPLGTVPQPTLSDCSGGGTRNGNTFSQGVYLGGIHISGGGSNNTYTFNPGVYCLVGGGLTVTGNAQVVGAGVTFFMTYDATHAYNGVNLGGTTVTNISAPTSGAWKGILFFQDRSVPINTSPSSFDGSNGATFTGALYFPTTTVQFKGTPGTGSYAPIIGYEIEFKGNATMKNAALPNNQSPIPGATLVE